MQNSNTNSSSSWPPAYSIRKSSRAKHLQMRVTRHNGLEVIVPSRASRPPIDKMLNDNRGWIEAQLAKLPPPPNRPCQLDLPMLNEVWQISYLSIPEQALSARADPHGWVITFTGDLSNESEIYRQLGQFIRNRAKRSLAELTADIADQMQVTYSGLSIRRQRTRWGSCNQRGVINLNDKLLFLPLNLGRHVIIHELCHRVHMNHSAAFWRLVAKYDPHWKHHNYLLRQADKHIPAWLS